MLADLPVSLVDALRGRDAALEALGTRCFRDLVRLPRPGLARRFGKALLLDAGDSIVLKCGSAAIAMKKDGTISIEGKDITINGSGKITIKASGEITMKGSKINQN